MLTMLTDREKKIANYLTEKHRAELEKINPNCASPLIAVRQTVRPTALKIGAEVLENVEWANITKWIAHNAIGATK